MRQLVFSLLLLLVLTSCDEKKHESTYSSIGEGIEKAEAFGFKLNMQSSTFADLTLVEVFERTQELNIHHVEVELNHTLGGQWGNQTFNHKLSEEEQQQLSTLAARYGITIVGMSIPTAEKEIEWESAFSFAKQMGLEYLVCEPKVADLSKVATLAVDNGIKVGISNSLAPSEYFNPVAFLDKTKDYSNQLGACVDAVNWFKEGYDQIECLELLRGHVQSIHLTDIDIVRVDKDGIPYHPELRWGTGIIDVDAILIELKKQGYKGYITLRYQKDTKTFMQDLKDSIGYYDTVTQTLFKDK